LDLYRKFLTFYIPCGPYLPALLSQFSSNKEISASVNHLITNASYILVITILALSINQFSDCWICVSKEDQIIMETTNTATPIMPAILYFSVRVMLSSVYSISLFSFGSSLRLNKRMRKRPRNSQRGYDFFAF
jgi:hypothetical protein